MVIISISVFCNSQWYCLVEFCAKSMSVSFHVMYVDGMWPSEFAQHQPPVVQYSPNRGSGSDSSSNLTGHGPLPAPGLLPAVQRALFVRLTQKYQEGEEPSGTQPQRVPSKEEGMSGIIMVFYLFRSLSS